MSYWMRTLGWKWFMVEIFRHDWEIKNHKPYYQWSLGFFTFLFHIGISGPWPWHLGNNDLCPIIGKKILFTLGYLPHRWTLKRRPGEAHYRQQLSATMRWPFWDGRSVYTVG